MSDPKHADHALVCAAIRKEPEALRWLEQRLCLVPRLVARLGRHHRGIDASELKDAGNEAVRVAMKGLGKYHGDAPFEAWLTVLCGNVMRNMWRRRQRSPHIAMGEEPIGAEIDPLTNVIRAERNQRVRAAIDRVGGAEAEVIRWYALQGIALDTIAEHRGVPLATVRTRYYRGMEKLRSYLAADRNFAEGPP